MEIKLLIRKLNATETGVTGMNDSYILIPQAYSHFFGSDSRITFYDKEGKAINGLNFKNGKECRIYASSFFRTNSIKAGDEILIERIKKSKKRKYTITIKNKCRSISFVFKSKHIICFNEDRLGALLQNPFKEQVSFKGRNVLFEIKKASSFTFRTRRLNSYELFIDNTKFNLTNSNCIFELNKENGKYILNEYPTCEYYKFNF